MGDLHSPCLLKLVADAEAAGVHERHGCWKLSLAHLQQVLLCVVEGGHLRFELNELGHDGGKLVAHEPILALQPHTHLPLRCQLALIPAGEWRHLM